MLDRIKIRLELDTNDKDLLLYELIEDTTLEVTEYLNTTELSNVAQAIVRDLVIIKYNKLGSEGLSSESYSGVNQSFIDGIPKDIKDRLRRIRKLPRR